MKAKVETFREYFINKYPQYGDKTWGVSGELYENVFERIVDTGAEYVEYRIECTLNHHGMLRL